MYDYNYTLGWVLWKKEDALSIQGVVLQIAEESLTVKVIFKPKDEKIALCEEAFGKCWRERKCQGQNLCAKRAMCVQGIRENQCVWSFYWARQGVTWHEDRKERRVQTSTSHQGQMKNDQRIWGIFDYSFYLLNHPFET